MAGVVRELKEKLGDEGMAGLQTFVDDAGREWKDDVLAVVGERFERRLGVEIGFFRVEVAKQLAAFRAEVANEFAASRVDMAKELAAVHVELAETRARLIKWSFLFWIGQVAVMVGVMSLLMQAIVPK
jgi:hypothetical protein